MPTVASILQKIADIETLRAAIDARIAAGITPVAVDLTPIDAAVTKLGIDVQNTLNSLPAAPVAAK